jgi:hypothetical protein
VCSSDLGGGSKPTPKPRNGRFKIAKTPVFLLAFKTRHMSLHKDPSLHHLTFINKRWVLKYTPADVEGQRQARVVIQLKARDLSCAKKERDIILSKTKISTPQKYEQHTR